MRGGLEIRQPAPHRILCFAGRCLRLSLGPIYAFIPNHLRAAGILCSLVAEI